MPKLKLGADRLAPGCVPVPLKVTVWVAVAAPVLLSVMVRVPVAGPLAAGANVTLMVQEAPSETLVPQLSVSLKLGVEEIAKMLRTPVPVLLRVIG